jgi:ABC-type glycerol-3-phosphate transport system substrate-binding protein
MTPHPNDDLAAFALGALDPEEARAVGAHLDACALCRAEVKALEEAAFAVAETAERDVPAGLRRAIVERARREPSVTRRASGPAALLDALSEKDFIGPDIIALPATWTRRYQSKLQPAPATVTMPFVEIKGTVKKEQVGELRTIRLPTPPELPNVFLDAVAGDAVLTAPDGRDAIYGFPLHVDTLVLYANRALLNAAGIPEPAITWSELQQHVTRLTRVGADGALLQSGIALGTAANVQRSFDILSLLMMQNGAQMTSRGTPSFHQLPAGLTGRTSPPGADAVRFYTDFADPTKPAYAWNAEQPDSLEAFLQGRVAYFFGYSYHRPIIAARAPRLNLSLPGLPHLAAAVAPTTGTVVGSDVIEGTQAVAINYANLWLQTISERTKYPNETWDLVNFMATKTPVVKQVLAASQRPTALRSLVAEQLQDPQLKVFAAQLLTARTWYRGVQPEAAETAFHELMDDVLGGADPNQALQLTAEKVNQTL